ncbi:MAG: hypothetical protein QHH01_01290, partial [Spirochaetales bacterium]|nr:hypothetical protein [Spirochaetales bacterium]
TPELINLPWLLAQSDMPVSFNERMTREEIPLLVLGGSSAVTAGAVLEEPQGILQDSMVDAIFFGEGEGHVRELAGLLAIGKAKGLRKQDILHLINVRVPGFWPCCPSPHVHLTFRALAEERPAILTSPLMLNSNAAAAAKLAITAGCTGHCSFCLEGWDRRPFAPADTQKVLDAALRMKKATGVEDLELFSYNFNMHPFLDSLLPQLARLFSNVSLMSQRIDVLADAKGLFDAEMAVGKRSFTLGIEGISYRMLQFYHKGIELRHIEEAIRLILGGNARELKLFFIISGYEDEHDLSAFETLCSEIDEMRRDLHAATRILVSAGYLVRLPFTPLQYDALQPDRQKLSQISDRLADICTRHACEFRLAASFEEYWLDQLLSLGGAAAHGWLVTVPAQGFDFDMHVSRAAMESLDSWLRQTPGWNALLAEKPEYFHPNFSWIEPENHWELVRKHYERARQALMATSSAHKLHASRASLLSKAGRTSRAWDVSTLAALQAVYQAKKQFEWYTFEIEESPDLAGATAMYRRSRLLRFLFDLVPNAERAIFAAREIYPSGEWAERFDMAARVWNICGKKRYGIAGPKAAVLETVVRKAAAAERNLIAASNLQSWREHHFHRDIRLLDAAGTASDARACRLEIRLEGIDISAAMAQLDAWLREQSVRYVLRHRDYDMLMVPAASRSSKSVLYGGVLRQEGNDCLKVELTIGIRADLEFLGKRFADLLHARPMLKLLAWESEASLPQG